MNIVESVQIVVVVAGRNKKKSTIDQIVTFLLFVSLTGLLLAIAFPDNFSVPLPGAFCIVEMPFLWWIL